MKNNSVDEVQKIYKDKKEVKMLTLFLLQCICIRMKTNVSTKLSLSGNSSSLKINEKAVTVHFNHTPYFIHLLVNGGPKSNKKATV